MAHPGSPNSFLRRHARPSQEGRTMATSLTNGLLNSIEFTPQAVNDSYSAASTGLTEDSSGIVWRAVMANDLGGTAKILYSLDNAISTGGAKPDDLFAQDLGRTEALSSDTSLNGARIWIGTDGRVGYDAATLNALVNASDVDSGSTLSVVGVPPTLPAGVSYNASTHAFTLNPAHAAYQY